MKKVIMSLVLAFLTVSFANLNLVPGGKVTIAGVEYSKIKKIHSPHGKTKSCPNQLT